MKRTDTILKIMSYLEYLDKLIDITQKMYVAVLENNLDLLIFESSNKDRIINILHGQNEPTQRALETFFDLESADFKMDILKQWTSDIARSISIVEKIDQMIVDHLEKQKKAVRDEIASTSSNRIKFRGYDHSSTRR